MSISSSGNSPVLTVNMSDLDNVISKLSGGFSGESKIREDQDIPMLPHLSAEFMLFLWHLSDERGGSVEFDSSEEGELGDSSHIDLWMDDRLGFRGKDESRVSTLCTGENPSISPESKTSISGGKVLSEVRIGIRSGDVEFCVTLKGQGLLIHGAALPRTMSDDDSLQGDIHDRMYLIEMMDKIIAKLFCMFCSERVNGYANDRGARISEWIKETQ